MRFLLPISAFLFLVAAPVVADTLRVPQDFATIQAAVNAAAPGDRIKIGNGQFVENVFVPAGVDGLIIEGSGKTIVDARVLGSVGSGAALSIGSNAVVVRRLTVRHGKGVPAIGLFIIGDDAVVERVTALHCEDFGIDVLGDRARIDRCVAVANAVGIFVSGDDAVVRKAKVQSATNAGVFVIGAHANIEACSVARSDFDGILAAGPHATVSKCTVASARHNGILVTGIGEPTITKNIVRDVSDAAAIEIVGATAGLVEGNRVADVRLHGIQVTAAAGLLIRKNRVDRAGRASAGFLLAGNNCTVLENLAHSCAGDGFNIAGSFHVLTKNRALANDEDGFDVEVGPTTLVSNLALGNGAEGLDNDPFGSVFIANRAQGNRLDVANAGGFANFEANVFVSGGTAFLPQIDL